MKINKFCPTCGSNNISIFYETKNVPVNNCLLLSSKQQAENFPTGNVTLGFCNDCGFIFNIDYDSCKVDYSSAYEDQQCFSPTFKNFAENLAKELICKYNLHNKKILEIGCGKGDFLALLCRLGLNMGVGIDPAYIKGRIDSEGSDWLTFIRDFFSEKYSNYIGDFVCCRHTLEHIPNTFEFVNTVRRSICNKFDTTLFFELPDVSRVLDEIAFWDIYYEHCSYFSSGSLGRLFRSCNFDIVDISKDFNDQYLLIEAKPRKGKSETPHKNEETVNELKKKVDFFSMHCRETLDQWKNRLNSFSENAKRVVIWGSSSKCVSFLSTLDATSKIEFVVDINPYRHGKYLPGIGKEVMSPQILKKHNPDLVIVMNPIYHEEISQMLNEMSLFPEVVSI